MAAPPIVLEALTRSVSFLHHTWALPRNRYTRLALESSRKLAHEGDETCWYAQTDGWFKSHGFSIDHLPPFQYSLDAPSLELSKQEVNKLIKQDLIQKDTKRTWIEPGQKLGTKMAFYQKHFLHLTEDGFITRPEYMNTHMPFNIRYAIGQIRTSSHHLEVEKGRYSNTPPEQRICQICHYEPETEEHHICRCTAYYEIRGRFHCLFKEGFGPLSQVMDYCDQKCLGLFLLEIKKHREGILKRKGNIKTGPTQKHMADFFIKTTLPQGEEEKKVEISKGVLLDRAVQLGKLRRPKKKGVSIHRKKIYKCIRGILACHQKQTPRFLNQDELERVRQRPMKDLLR